MLLQTPTTTTVETSGQPTIIHAPGWQQTAYAEIRNGSWAVILVAIVAYVTFKGSFSKYMGKHLDLMDTMKNSLSKNAESLEALADTEKDQTDVLRVQGAMLIKQGDAILAQQNTLANIDERHKQAIDVAMDVIRNTNVTVKEVSTDTEDIANRISELKDITGQYQAELIEKLQTIEDLYHASEVATGNKGNIRNFWNR